MCGLGFMLLLLPNCAPLVITVARQIGKLQVLCAVGGDEEALQCHVGKTAAETKPEQGSSVAARDGATGTSDLVAGATASVDEPPAAENAAVLSPGKPGVQQGWLPGIGPSGVVVEWSHWEAKPQKLEAMLNNVVHILDMMMTLSSSHVGIKALDDKVGLSGEWTGAYLCQTTCGSVSCAMRRCWCCRMVACLILRIEIIHEQPHLL